MKFTHEVDPLCTCRDWGTCSRCIELIKKSNQLAGVKNTLKGYSIFSICRTKNTKVFLLFTDNLARANYLRLQCYDYAKIIGLEGEFSFVIEESEANVV